MSASASPGRTWHGRVVERGLPILAGTVAAAFLGAGRCLAGVSNMGRLPAPANDADLWNESDSGCQSII